MNDVEERTCPRCGLSWDDAQQNACTALPLYRFEHPCLWCGPDATRVADVQVVIHQPGCPVLAAHVVDARNHIHFTES